MPPKRLLATDLDGTLIGNDDAMREVCAFTAARPDVLLAFSTGRRLATVEEFYREKNLAACAEVCICMVGTDVFFRRDGRYELDRAWHTRIGVEWEAGAVRRIVGEFPAARPQPDEWQSAFKCSYYLEQAEAGCLGEIERRLRAADVRAQIVYSVGFYLDILPARSGKGHAVRYVAEQFGITPENVVVCGDTGNDLAMMQPELGFRCIAVGNATPELRQACPPHVYRAAGHHGAGILEGLREFGWLR